MLMFGALFVIACRGYCYWCVRVNSGLLHVHDWFSQLACTQATLAHQNFVLRRRYVQDVGYYGRLHVCVCGGG